MIRAFSFNLSELPLRTERYGGSICRLDLFVTRVKSKSLAPLSFLFFVFRVYGTTRLVWHNASSSQASRSPDCQGACALCADLTSPCQNCFQGNPSVTVCDDPTTRVFYDQTHFTTEFHLIVGEAIRQCSKDTPNYNRPLVNVICPAEAG